MSIEKTYESLEKRFPHATDSLEVVKQVEEYRQFWKPKEVKVVLLAESHVYTDKRDYEVKLQKLMREIVPNYPQYFVRFVYCLGYGENELLERTIKKNTGTPQFWKIFSSSVAESEQDLGFHRILKTKTPSFLQRLRNKVDILRKMEEKGVWLLDASIVGIYGSDINNLETKKRVIEVCWENHLANMVQESNPKHIIVIGKGVKDILRFKLWKLQIPFTTIPSPQNHVDSLEQMRNYKNYQRICAKFC